MKKLVCIVGIASLLAAGITGCGDDKKDSKSCDAAKPSASCTCNTKTGQWENCGSTQIQCNTANKPSALCTCDTSTGQWVNCGSTTPIQCDQTNKPSPACTCNTTTGQWENCGGTTPKQCDQTNKPSATCTCNTTTGQWENCGSTTETCDESTFESRCDDQTLVYCDEGTVQRYDCQEDYDEAGNIIKDTTMICVKSTSETKNYANCVWNDPSQKCNTLNVTEPECTVEIDYLTLAEIEETWKCVQFDNGQKYWQFVTEKFCSNRCEDGCEVQTCAPNSAPSCSSDGLALNCLGEGSDWQTVAINCSKVSELLEATFECAVLEDEGETYADCEYVDDEE